jgi:anaerobic sulfite reductase subunit A
MGFELNIQSFNNVLKSLSENYIIYAPVRLKGKGMYSDTDLVTYGEISSYEEIELSEKSRYSPKEVIYPITQTLFYFTEEGFREPSINNKGIIILMRPCDANAYLRLDNIFLKNGPYQDNYYKKLRDKVKFFIIECTKGFSTCFCVSTGSNKFLDYDAFFRFEGDKITCDVKNDEFNSVFESGKKIEFEPKFIEKNEIEVKLPDVNKVSQNLEYIFNHELWEEYTKRCIACGRCTVSCPTCSCFTMQDIFYKDNPKCGERRRVWASCMVDGFTDVAGGHSYRQKYGERMRFKTMHKVYDYTKRFGIPMCIGCGRCDDVCPEYISFINIINKVYKAVEERSETK